MSKNCVQCNKQIHFNGKNNNVKYCSKECSNLFNYQKRKTIWTERNRAKYNKQSPDKMQCPYCNGWYLKLAAHTVQRHGVDNRELKEELGLDRKKGLIPIWHKEELQDHVNKNYDLVVAKNLLEKGLKTRFSRGHKITYKRSKQTMERLKNQFKHY